VVTLDFTPCCQGHLSTVPPDCSSGPGRSPASVSAPPSCSPAVVKINSQSTSAEATQQTLNLDLQSEEHHRDISQHPNSTPSNSFANTQSTSVQTYITKTRLGQI